MKRIWICFHCRICRLISLEVLEACGSLSLLSSYTTGKRMVPTSSSRQGQVMLGATPYKSMFKKKIKNSKKIKRKNNSSQQATTTSPLGSSYNFLDEIYTFASPVIQTTNLKPGVPLISYHHTI